MRRIYESRALERGDEPFTPSKADDDKNSRRTVNWDAFSHAFMPKALRNRAIDVSVTTDRDTYELGEPVRIGLEFRNRIPFPVRLRTESPNVWTWAINGIEAASQVPRAVPERPDAFSFSRSERKRFRREWPQRIQVAPSEWESVDPGTYTIEVAIACENAEKRGLTDRTDIQIRD